MKSVPLRSVDVAQHLGVKKPSVCNAVSILEQGGFLVKDEDHFLHLTEKGRETAEAIYERHCYFKNWLIEAGVEAATAEQEACRIEHDISEQSFRKLKKWKELGHSEETNGD
ncbi:metal-dependent transcriptional regulator [Mediterraneibacter glycyrrhizinilyticus]|nr:metal-dependent transcriptional regulator [Mediterraneibacter glycyrrhizinilyticus]MBM6804380.1 metal-dependent transcriptional regulator [Mediterraneibacter glycyrrhizinilyticus]